MYIQKYINWNTLKMDAWTSSTFYILPSISLNYDRNSIWDEGYIKEFRISFDIFMITTNYYIRWKQHNNLL